MGSFVSYSLLNECNIWGYYNEAEYIYNLMLKKDTVASNLMIRWFWHLCEVEKFEQLLTEKPVNDTISWSALINCYREREMYGDALYLFITMLDKRITIDGLVVEAVLPVCSDYAYMEDEDIDMGELIHSLVVKIGIESDVGVQNSLICMYSAHGHLLSAQILFNVASWLHQSSWTCMLNGYVKCGLDESAKALFESMPEKDPASWTVMISYYSGRHCFSEGLALFQEMLRSGIRLDKHALGGVIRDLPRRFAAVDLGKCIHAYLIKNGYNLKHGGRFYKSDDSVFVDELGIMYSYFGCKFDHHQDFD